MGGKLVNSISVGGKLVILAKMGGKLVNCRYKIDTGEVSNKVRLNKPAVKT
jgi:hypothetical protein